MQNKIKIMAGAVFAALYFLTAFWSADLQACAETGQLTHRHIGSRQNGGGCYGKLKTETWDCRSYQVSVGHNGTSYIYVCGQCGSRWSSSGKVDEPRCNGQGTTTYYEVNCGKNNAAAVSFSCEPSTRQWTKELDLTASYSVHENGISISGFLWNGSPGGASCRVTENGTYTLGLTGSGNVDFSTTVSVTVDHIDRMAPVISSFWTAGAEWGTSAELLVSASDSESGLHGEAYSYDGGVSWSASSAHTVTENGTYRVSVRDAVGNVSTAETTVENIDRTPPTVSVTTSPSADNWYEGSLTVTVQAQDAESGLADAPYSFDGGATYLVGNSTALSESRTLEIAVKDKAGNIARYSFPVRKKQRPQPTPAPGGGSGNTGNGGGGTGNIGAGSHGSGGAAQSGNGTGAGNSGNANAGLGNGTGGSLIGTTETPGTGGSTTGSGTLGVGGTETEAAPAGSGEGGADKAGNEGGTGIGSGGNSTGNGSAGKGTGVGGISGGNSGTGRGSAGIQDGRDTGGNGTGKSSYENGKRGGLSGAAAGGTGGTGGADGMQPGEAGTQSGVTGMLPQHYPDRLPRVENMKGNHPNGIGESAEYGMEVLQPENADGDREPVQSENSGAAVPAENGAAEDSAANGEESGEEDAVIHKELTASVNGLETEGMRLLPVCAVILAVVMLFGWVLLFGIRIDTRDEKGHYRFAGITRVITDGQERLRVVPLTKQIIRNSKTNALRIRFGLLCHKRCEGERLLLRYRSMKREFEAGRTVELHIRA